MKLSRPILITVLVLGSTCFSQTGSLEDFENRKTGNFREVLNSFYQLTSKNLTGAEKSLAFNSTLFAVKANADPNINIDRNLKEQRFARNLQLNFRVAMDQTFSYSGFAAGFTYAVVNERDKQIVRFQDDAITKNYDRIFTEINNWSSEYIAAYIRDNNPSPEQISSLISELNTATNSFLTSKNTSNLPAGFRDYLNGKGVDKSIVAFDSLVQNYYRKVDKAALWTVYADGGANKQGKSDRFSLGSTFLKGDFAGGGELDIRSVFTYADTLNIPNTIRKVLTTTGGLNFSLLRSAATSESLFEIKAYVEYNRVFSMVLADEREDNFLGNADIRIRLWQGFWVPVTIKYDIKEANFLGFLNVTYNFDQSN